MYNALRKLRDAYNNRKSLEKDPAGRAQFERMAVEAVEQCAEYISTMDVVVVKPEGPDPEREVLKGKRVNIPEIPPEEDFTEIKEENKKKGEEETNEKD